MNQGKKKRGYFRWIIVVLLVFGIVFMNRGRVINFIKPVLTKSYSSDKKFRDVSNGKNINEIKQSKEQGVFVFPGSVKAESFPLKQEENDLRIGLITDAHFNVKRNAKKDRDELIWKSAEPVERFVEKMNDEFYPDLVVQNGDWIDGHDKKAYTTFQQALELMKGNLQIPLLNVLGNHETNSFRKDVWLKLTGSNSTYYYQDFDKANGKYRVVVLDANFKSERDGDGFTPDDRYYPGYINKTQWFWLENVLKEAQKEGRVVVVFVHQPPIKTRFFTTWGHLFPQGPELHNLFARYGVKAVFSGHIEDLCNIEDRGVHYFALDGLYKTARYLQKKYRFKDAGCFYYIDINKKDEPEVVMEYRVFDENKKGNHTERTVGWFRLPVTTDYDCQDKNWLDQEYLRKERGKREIMPIVFLDFDLPELSGLTFWNKHIYLAGDEGELWKIDDESNKIVKHKQGGIVDPEGLTNDGKFLYVLSEFEKSVYRFNENFEFVDRRKIPLDGDDVNFGPEGIAYYKDNLFFIVNQSRDVDNVILFDYENGKIVKSTKLEKNDLSGATVWENRLYVISSASEEILAIDPETLEIILFYELDDKTAEGLDIKNNKIYLVRDNEEELKNEGKL